MAAHRKYPPVQEQVYVGLAACRAQGLDFDRAWRRVVTLGATSKSDALVRLPHDTSHRRGWKAALEATRGEWAAAYRGEPTSLSRALERSEVLRDADVDRSELVPPVRADGRPPRRAYVPYLGPRELAA